VLKLVKPAGQRPLRTNFGHPCVRGTESEQVNDIEAAGEAASPERGTAGEFDSRERGSWSA